MDTVTQRAYGKINLSLDVVGRRSDGYHLVRMVMQTVDIYDTVTIERTGESGIALKVTGTAGGGGMADTGVPTGPDNLAFRAAAAMQQYFHLTGGLEITLQKRIPIAAGMAGGSADAAAVFRGIRNLYGLTSEASDEVLRSLALPLGADIPYCIGGGTQLAEGIGERLTCLPAAPRPEGKTVVIVKPDINVSTGWVYKAFDAIPATEIRHPDVDEQVKAIRQQDYVAMAAACGNVLEQQTGREYPVIGELEQWFRQQEALQTIMTGSGPTVFALFNNADAASAAYDLLRQCPKYHTYQIFLTEFCSSAGSK